WNVRPAKEWSGSLTCPFGAPHRAAPVKMKSGVGKQETQSAGAGHTRPRGFAAWRGFIRRRHTRKPKTKALRSYAPQRLGPGAAAFGLLGFTNYLVVSA